MQSSLTERSEREGVAVKRARPSGPTSREASPSSKASRRERAASSNAAVSASEAAESASAADFLPAFLGLLVVGFGFEGFPLLFAVEKFAAVDDEDDNADHRDGEDLRMDRNISLSLLCLSNGGFF